MAPGFTLNFPNTEAPQPTMRQILNEFPNAHEVAQAQTLLTTLNK